ncbi:MAG TPA: hypothetical protein VNA16_10435, partial [Abditibacteriaceae bacterium]|nr:hypothetical protein [Abditibacteriaceae bacterium]
MLDNRAPQRPPLNLLMAVALISAAVHGFEVSLTRVFAVLLRYHFAFLVISIALCGLGLGGYAAHWLRRWKSPSLPLLSVLFALSIDLSLLLILRGVFARFPESFWIAALIVLVPFTIAGVFLAEVFARYPAWSGRLYAWDLAGAALAAGGVVALLQVFGAIDACLAVAVIAAVAGICLLPRATGINGVVVAAPVLLMLVLVLNPRLRWLDIPPVPPRLDANQMSLADKGVTQPLFTELGTPGHTSKIRETRWNAFARTDVVLDAAMPDSFYIYTNGNVPTNMMRWDGRIESIGAIAADFPLSDWTFDIAPLGRRGRPGQRYGHVLAIGPGGGMDALLALHHGATRFDGAEINPSIVGLMHDYREFNGGLYERRDVRVVTAEGRAFVREAIARGKEYSLLFSALTKTATAGQGMALLESFVYTTDAFKDYLKALKSNGQLTIVLDEPRLLARFFATALSVLREQGIEERAACRHIAIVFDPRPGPYAFALVVQKSAFSRAQTFDMDDAARQRGLTPIWIPYQAARADFGPYPDIAERDMSLEEFIAWWRTSETPIDVTPCPDNRPFVLDMSLTVLPIFKQLAGLAALLSLGLVAVSWRGGRARADTELDSALAQNERASLNPSDALFVLYFLALGVGFMLVEIPLAQKLILPLGYPTLALTVILFSILLGGGVGSWASQRCAPAALARWAAGCALGVAVATVFGIFLLSRLESSMLVLSLPLRCLATAVLLLPLGFLLGAP